MKQQISVDGSFSTPILKSRLPGFDDHRVGLLEFAHDLARRTEGIQSSNYDGWHSHRYLHVREDHREVRWLVARLGLVVVRMLESVSGSGVNLRFRELWVNVNGSGSWNVPHIHPVSWAGIVYVSDPPEPGEIRAGRRFGDGDTVFFNPVPEAAYYGHKNTTIMRGEAGQVLLFPGYLMHMVIPHKNPEPRVTFAFNIDTLKKRADRAQKPVPDEQAAPRVRLLVD